jgi:hypothetical protein
VGLFGVFAAVYQAATNEAREVTKMITGGTEAKFQDLLISYGNLASKREVMEAELTRTREDLEKFRNTDPAKISQIVASLNTEGHSVLEKVTQILNKRSTSTESQLLVLHLSITLLPIIPSI